MRLFLLVLLYLIIIYSSYSQSDTDPCKLEQIPKDYCPEHKTFDNIFMEDYRFYNDNTIVYIYDFHRDPALRNFYKITKNKENQGLDIIDNIKLEKFENELKIAKNTFKNAPDLTNETNFRAATTKVDNLKKEINKNRALKIEVVNFNKEVLTSSKNVKFKIYNINKFMYDVSIGSKVIQFDSEPSELFNRLFLGDNTLLSNLIGSFSVQKSGEEPRKIDALITEINCFANKYNDLHNKVLNAYDPCGKFPCCYSITYLELANDLAKIRAKSSEMQIILNEKKALVTNCKDAKKKMNENKEKIKKLTADSLSLEKIINELKIDKKALEDEIKTLTTDAQKEEKKKKEEQLAAKNKEFSTKTTELEKLKPILKDEINASVNLQKEKNNLCNNESDSAEKELKELIAINSSLESLPSEQDLKKIIVFLRNMVETNNSHTIDFISLNGNRLDLTVSISSKDSIFKHFNLSPYKNEPDPIQIPIICKPFVSFSSGSFMALGRHLQNKTYAWQEIVGNNNTADLSKFTLVESAYTLPAMGFCALGNVEWKLSRSFGIGPSAGVGISIENNPRITYLLGFSLFFGDMRQFAFSTGFIGMQVDRLSNNFQYITDNQINYTSKPGIEYYKELKIGSFISLTYTPFTIYKPKNN
ncbi:MAG: hypothetical protein KA536_10325 [Saprospiraceae bacterium]|nr:hypothetical protein [Saprospiraceae bacterium]